MLKFVSHISMMLSLGTILYLFARALPRVNDTEIQSRKSFIKTHIIFHYAEKIDTHLKYMGEKTLRRLGLVLLKLENKVNKKLAHIKKENTPKESFVIPEEKNNSSDLPTGR